MQFFNNLIDNLKKIFRKILLIGDYESQDMVCEQVKDIFDEKYYESKDVYHISRGTERQDELHNQFQSTCGLEKPVLRTFLPAGKRRYLLLP